MTINPIKLGRLPPNLRKIGKVAFQVMKELRINLNMKDFLCLLRLAQSKSGYTLLGAFDVNHCLGLLGYRILIDFVHGRHLYIDDLVVSAHCRSKGIGALILAKAKEIAIQNECTRIRLCTGIDNKRGMEFYERNGWNKKAVVYKLKI